jgi:hypothetical protein
MIANFLASFPACRRDRRRRASSIGGAEAALQRTAWTPGTEAAPSRVELRPAHDVSSVSGGKDRFR